MTPLPITSIQSVKPTLSVIMPVFNCERFVAQAIESVLGQSFTDLELLIADDGSTDASKLVIDKYAGLDGRIKSSHNVVNTGKVDTVNRLFKLCKGEFITVHDADDYSHVRRFECQIGLLKDQTDLVMCGTSFQIITAKGDPFRDVIMPGSYEEILARITHSSQFHGPTMVIRRESITGSLYRAFFKDYNEDCDLAFRLVDKGRCINLPDVLYTYRIVPNSLSKVLTPEKKNYYRMAATFYHQRRHSETDDLIRGEALRVTETLQGLLRPYEDDPSLIHRENAAFQMYYKLYLPAIYNAWKACRVRPFKIVNWRTLQYCIRKGGFGI